MAVCEICKKQSRVGNKVSHANNKTKRLFHPNIQRIKIMDGVNVRKAYVCTRCIKTNRVAKAQ